MRSGHGNGMDSGRMPRGDTFPGVERDMSVVIPFHIGPTAGRSPDGAPLVLRTLRALRRCAGRPCEVICVDDNSRHPLRSAIESLGAVYVRTPAPRATPHVARRALARQVGADRARGRMLLFLDADIVIPTRTLEAIARTLASRGGNAVVFVPRRPAGVPVAPGAAGWTAADGYAYAACAAGPDDGSRGRKPPVWARLTSHCFALHRDLLREVGGWDTLFVGWGEEDTELFYRLFRKGASFHALNDEPLFVKHVAHRVSHEVNMRSFRRNARYFMAKFPEIARLRQRFYEHHGVRPAARRHQEGVHAPRVP